MNDREIDQALVERAFNAQGINIPYPIQEFKVQQNSAQLPFDAQSSNKQPS